MIEEGETKTHKEEEKEEIDPMILENFQFVDLTVN